MITVIPNQPIRLRDSNTIDESCDCLGQRYCQLINVFDNTQFQIKSSNLVTNGTFTSNLDGWNVFLSITIELINLVNPSFEECDGEFEISASGGVPGYTYSIDGGVTFGASPIFTDLCPGAYTIIVKDSEDNEGSLFITIYENIDCSEYQGTTIQDLIDDGIVLGQLYNCTLGDLQP